MVEFGFNGETLTSQNSIIIISYYIYKDGDLSSESKINIKNYLIRSLLNGIYGGSQEQVMKDLREAFRKEEKDEIGNLIYKGKFKTFPLDDIIKLKLPQEKTLLINEEKINRYLQFKKGPQAFFVLSLLYPNLRYGQVLFHQDHIHPEARFSDKNLMQINISKDEWQDWKDKRDSIPNLQLLEGIENSSKNDTLFVDWINKKTKEEKEKFFSDNYIPQNIDLSISNFLEFYEQRRIILKKSLMEILAVSSESSIFDAREASQTEEFNEGDLDEYE